MTAFTSRDEILEALAGLADAIDSRDWGRVGATFLPDASGYGAAGRDEIVARMRAHLDGVGRTQHLLGNHRVKVDGDTARSLSYARVYHVGAGPMEGSFYECCGEYDDRWVRTDDGWRLQQRVFDLQISLGDFTVLRPAD